MLIFSKNNIHLFFIAKNKSSPKILQICFHKYCIDLLSTHSSPFQTTTLNQPFPSKPLHSLHLHTRSTPTRGCREEPKSAPNKNKSQTQTTATDLKNHTQSQIWRNLTFPAVIKRLRYLHAPTLFFGKPSCSACGTIQPCKSRQGCIE